MVCAWGGSGKAVVFITAQRCQPKHTSICRIPVCIIYYKSVYSDAGSQCFTAAVQADVSKGKLNTSHVFICQTYGSSVDKSNQFGQNTKINPKLSAQDILYNIRKTRNGWTCWRLWMLILQSLHIDPGITLVVQNDSTFIISTDFFD